MDLLENLVRGYSWGSRTVIARLQDRPVPSAEPEAELWLGAHPRGPSYLVGPDGHRRSLLTALRHDPAGLGKYQVQRRGGQLPVLLKDLVVDTPLSLQIHPNTAPAVASRDGRVHVEHTPGHLFVATPTDYRKRLTRPYVSASRGRPAPCPGPFTHAGREPAPTLTRPSCTPPAAGVITTRIPRPDTRHLDTPVAMDIPSSTAPPMYLDALARLSRATGERVHGP